MIVIIMISVSWTKGEVEFMVEKLSQTARYSTIRENKLARLMSDGLSQQAEGGREREPGLY